MVATKGQVWRLPCNEVMGSSMIGAGTPSRNQKNGAIKNGTIAAPCHQKAGTGLCSLVTRMSQVSTTYQG